MFIHSVFFWLKDGLSADEIAAFESGLEVLCTKTTAKSGYYGKPADTPARGVVDKSYNYGMYLFFDDMEAHDVYQVSEIHQKFIAAHQAKWTTVKVLDTLTV